MNYEALLMEAESHQLVVKEKPLTASDGRIKGKRIAIRKDIETTKEKTYVLAEELGHHYTSSGSINDMHEIQNRKQEHRARVWAYNKQVGLLGLIKAFEHGCRTVWEIAEFLDVPDKFLEEAITYYKEKYGYHTTIDQYVIYFIPNLRIGKVWGWLENQRLGDF